MNTTVLNSPRSAPSAHQWREHMSSVCDDVSAAPVPTSPDRSFGPLVALHPYRGTYATMLENLLQRAGSNDSVHPQCIISPLLASATLSGLGNSVNDHCLAYQAYMSRAEMFDDPTEKAFRLNGAIQSCNIALARADYPRNTLSLQLARLLMMRAHACMRLASTTFGSELARKQYESVLNDCGAVLGSDNRHNSALLMRARASIALACSPYSKSGTERDGRLKDALRDLETLRQTGLDSRSTIQVHIARLWMRNALVIAEQFSADTELTFPERLSELAKLSNYFRRIRVAQKSVPMDGASESIENRLSPQVSPSHSMPRVEARSLFDDQASLFMACAVVLVAMVMFLIVAELFPTVDRLNRIKPSALEK